MFTQVELNIPIEKVAEALSLRAGRAKDMFFSPMREENQASLHIDRAKNVWYDHGSGIGGTVAQLVMLARHCDKHSAYEFLRSLDPSIVQAAQQIPVAQKAPNEIKSVRDISCYYLKKYLGERKIPLDLARQYCKEVTIHSPEKGMNYTLVGFPNNSGAWALSSPSGFKSTTKADITTINMEGKVDAKPSSGTVAVFEGFFDFLSWQVLQSSKLPFCDIVVLNSVNNIEKARDYIAAHNKANCFLDNDAAGEKCYQRVREILSGKEAIDMSDLYGAKKDLNEFLQASRGYSSNTKLSLHP